MLDTHGQSHKRWKRDKMTSSDNWAQMRKRDTMWWGKVLNKFSGGCEANLLEQFLFNWKHMGNWVHDKIFAYKKLKFDGRNNLQCNQLHVKL